MNRKDLLSSYWDQLNKKEKLSLALSVDSDYDYLRMVFKYNKKPGAGLTKNLSKKTGIPAHIFRSDYFDPPSKISA